MIKRRLLLVLGVLAVAHASPARLSGQVVTGQVIDSTSGMPVGTGFVVLLDQSFREVARALSAGDGRFTLQAPGNGVYRLRSERIGYRAGVSEPFELASDAKLNYTLQVVAVPIVLATVEVSGEDRCHVRPERASETAVVWEEIRKALAATAWGAEQEIFRFSTYNYERDWDARRDSVTAETGYTVEGLASQSYRSLPADQLAAEGYAAAREDGDWYYLPDALTILDDAFLATHCFSTVRDSLRHKGLVGLAFEPIADRETIDVAGALWLDQASAQLRELDVRYTPLHESIGDDRVGGTVEFMMLPTGAWIVRRWQLRMPTLDSSVREILTEWGNIQLGRSLSITGFHDVGGEVLRVATRDGTTTYPGVVLSGVVLDSTTLRPIADVTVHLDGVNVATRTDSAGSFRLSDLSFGEHALVLLKEGFSPRTFRFEVTADQGDMDVGLVGLSRGPAPYAEISGTVVDVITNEPAVGVVVSVNDQTAAVTDIEGAFWIAASLRLGTNRLRLRRIGYRPMDGYVWIARDSSEFDLDIKLEPLPVELAEVVVEGERTIYDFSGRLRDFNRRRRSGLGSYFTREDIELRRPYYVSDLLARVPSVSVVPTVSGNIVRMRRFGHMCRPALYIDGVRLFDGPFDLGDGVSWLDSIDQLVMPDEIAGIEVYRGPSETPVELGMFEGACGVIAIWTRQR